MSFRLLQSPNQLADVVRTAFGAQATGNTAVTTTSETSAVSVTCTGIKGGTQVMIFGFLQLTTGTATTTVTVSIESGTAAGGAIKGEANAITIPTAAGSTDQYFLMVQDTAVNNDQAYNITVTQASATGNGTILFASIMVIPIATF